MTGLFDDSIYCSACGGTGKLMVDGLTGPCPSCTVTGDGSGTPLEPPGFDGDLARAAGDEGMAQARRAERVQAWKAQAEAWLLGLPAGSEVTADTLIAAIGLPDPEAGPARNNVVGAWFSAQARHGRVRWSGTFATSRREIGHGNLQRVWILT